MVVHIPTPMGAMSVQVDVIGADVPFLFGRDALDENRVQVLTVENKLQFVPLEDNQSVGAKTWLGRMVSCVCFFFLFATNAYNIIRAYI